MPYGSSYGGAGVFDPTSGMTIERLVDGKSLATVQNPTGTGEANAIQIEFGAALNGAGDPVQLLADGTLRINQAGLYRLKISLSYGRSGGSGQSELRFRALINGVQAGQSIGIEIDNANTTLAFADEAWLYLPAGLDITYEIMRDSSGNDSGGLIQPVVTAGTAPSWNPTTCAALRVERWAAP